MWKWEWVCEYWECIGISGNHSGAIAEIVIINIITNFAFAAIRRSNATNRSWKFNYLFLSPAKLFAIFIETISNSSTSCESVFNLESVGLVWPDEHVDEKRFFPSHSICTYVSTSSCTSRLSYHLSLLIVAFTTWNRTHTHTHSHKIEGERIWQTTDIRSINKWRV